MKSGSSSGYPLDEDVGVCIGTGTPPFRTADSQKEPRIVMTLLVRNEEDIIEDNILFHASQGVDAFIVMDNLSTDRTKEIITDLAKEIRIEYVYQQNDDYSQGQWVTSMARMAKSDLNADWVINNDADEFWVSADEDNLKEILRRAPMDVSALLVGRHNAVLESRLDIFSGVSSHPSVSYVFESRSKNVLGRSLPPKCLHRGSSDVRVQQGNHGVDGIAGETLSTSEIRILHFPYRSFHHYKTKIYLGGSAYLKNSSLPANAGATWKEHYRLLTTPEILEFWKDLHVCKNEIVMSTLGGHAFADRTVVECLALQHERKARNRLKCALQLLDRESKEAVQSFCLERYHHIQKIPPEKRNEYPGYRNLRFAVNGAFRHAELVHGLQRSINCRNILDSFSYLRDVFSLHPRNESSFSAFLRSILHIFFPDEILRLRNLIDGKNVILHVSCHSRLDRAQTALASFENCGDAFSNIIVVGDSDAVKQDQIPLGIRVENQVLYLPVSDSYEALATKVFYAFTILSLVGRPRFLIKLDDDICLGSPGDFEVYLDSLEHLQASYAGRAVGDLRHADQSHGWHIGKCMDSRLHARGYQFPVPSRYAAGGYGYVLGPQGLEACKYMYLAMKSFFDVDSMGMEDMYVGHAMASSGIELISKGIIMPSLALPGLIQVD